MRLLSMLLLAAVSCSQLPTTPPLPATLDQALEATYRTPEHMQRDSYRNPKTTLEFFGLKPDMTVIEIAPGRGWYMEILAPYLSAKGRYIMAAPLADRPYFVANEEVLNAWKKRFPHVKTESVIFSPPKNITLPKDASADMVVTFRNVHNWMTAQGEKEAFKSFFDALKPGGILGVVEHRALPTQKDPLAKSGYVPEAEVIKMAQAAGFKLVEKSEINANPKDTKNYPEGVWTLPPALRLGEKDRAKYMAIGESDRMTLKFIKP